MAQPTVPTPLDFEGLTIAPELLGALARINFSVPTPIQHQAIPIAITGQDLIGIAQTGTGKTLAFGIPMIQQLLGTQKRGLVLVPTRELAYQVEESFQKLAYSLGLRTAVLIGGEPIQRQIQSLKRNPQILVATPGRLVDHLEQKTLHLDNIGVLVLDEADRMFDMGFAVQLNRILAAVPTVRQTLLFSATMPPAILQIANKHMQKPLRVEVAPQGTTIDAVEQELFILPREQKPALLQKLLQEYHGSVLLFMRTKHHAKKLTHQLQHNGHSAIEIHSNRSLAQRRNALEGFKSGKHRILVATDIAARGIDVTGIEVVINYDLPDNSEDYVHRIGRTGRAGKTGRAISFATPDQRNDVNAIERLMRRQLPMKPVPRELPVLNPAPALPFAPAFRRPLPAARGVSSGYQARGRGR